MSKKENAMQEQVFIVAAIKPWNRAVFAEALPGFAGRWHFVSDPAELTVELVKKLKPAMIFFPHWSEKIADEILQLTECVCFHMTDVPYGRGGSPLQNLIAAGHQETVVSALKMTDELDAGPVYMKVPLPLHGLAEEIFIRAARIIAGMVETIARNRPVPVPQNGQITRFKRRKPEQSRIDENMAGLQLLFDHIRMLDAEDYPPAFIEYGSYRLEFSRPALKAGSIISDVKITLKKDHP